MPGRDATGPMGMGPMTGRAAGNCTDFGMPGSANKAGRRGFRMGFGRGNGFGGCGGGFRRRNRFFATGVSGRIWTNADPAAEKQALKSQSEYLQTEIDAIKKRLDELTAKDQSK
jgi:hypothetical protein